MALIAVFLACFRNYQPYLGPGEKCTIMIVAADRKQARVVIRFVRGLLARLFWPSGWSTTFPTPSNLRATWSSR